MEQSDRPKKFNSSAEKLISSKLQTKVLFDDFSYSNQKELKKHGWIVRTAPGWPGKLGETWSEHGVSGKVKSVHPTNQSEKPWAGISQRFQRSSSDWKDAREVFIRSILILNSFSCSGQKFSLMFHLQRRNSH